jgi:hypothetical protein
MTRLAITQQNKMVNALAAGLRDLEGQSRLEAVPTAE